MESEGIPGTRSHTEPAFELEAVGMDDDGKVKPLGELSFETSRNDLDFWKPRILGE